MWGERERKSFSIKEHVILRESCKFLRFLCKIGAIDPFLFQDCRIFVLSKHKTNPISEIHVTIRTRSKRDSFRFSFFQIDNYVVNLICKRFHKIPCDMTLAFVGVLKGRVFATSLVCLHYFFFLPFVFIFGDYFSFCTRVYCAMLMRRPEPFFPLPLHALNFRFDGIQEKKKQRIVSKFSR